MNKTKLQIRILLCSFFILFSKANYAADDGLRNPALLYVSIPIVSAVIAIIITSAFTEPDRKIESEISRMPKPKVDATSGFKAPKPRLNKESLALNSAPRLN